MRTKEVVFDHTSHTRLWQWLAQNPGKTKGEALKALGMSIPLGYNGCYACLYAAQYGRSIGAECNCVHCPLLVTDSDILQIPQVVKEYGMDRDSCLGGLYDAWEASNKNNNDDDVCKVALLIAALSVRAGVPIK